MMKYHNRWYTVLDPDLQMGGGGGEGSGGHPDPEKMGGEVSKEFFFNFFPPLGPQFGLKIRGGGVGRTSPWICQELSQLQILLKQFFTHVNDPVWNQSYEHRYYNLIYIVLTCCLQGQPASFQEKSLPLWLRVIIEDKQCVPNKMGGIGRREQKLRFTLHHLNTCKRFKWSNRMMSKTVSLRRGFIQQLSVINSQTDLK